MRLRVETEEERRRKRGRSNRGRANKRCASRECVTRAPCIAPCGSLYSHRVRSSGATAGRGVGRGEMGREGGAEFWAGSVGGGAEVGVGREGW